MPIEEFSYHGRQVVVDTEGDQPKVVIDGEEIPVVHSKVSGRFIATHHDGFRPHDSLEELVKGVIDHVINQRGS